MLTVATHRHAHRVDGFHRTHRVALDTGHLHQTADRVAGQAEVVFHADFRSVLDLLHAAAEHFAQGAGRHRTSHADLTLTADFGAGNRSVFLVKNADRGSGQ